MRGSVGEIALPIRNVAPTALLSPVGPSDDAAVRCADVGGRNLRIGLVEDDERDLTDRFGSRTVDSIGGHLPSRAGRGMGWRTVRRT